MLSKCFGWILNLQANREMHKVKIQVVQLQIFQRLIQAHRDVFWGMKGRPQLIKKYGKEKEQNIYKLKHC